LTKLLILDDSNVIRQVIRIYLTGLPYQLVMAADAESGLRECRQGNAEAVIADINLPGMSGIDFLKTLRADPDPRLKSLPVVLLTGQKGDALRTEGLLAGANAFVTKPVVGPALREALAEALKGKG